MFESCPKCVTPIVSAATTNTNYVVETPTTLTSDKKLTPMAAHIEWLKKERKTLYEFGYDVAADRISAAIDNATSLLEAEREYASQQAPPTTKELIEECEREREVLKKRLAELSTPPVSANDMTAEEFFNHPDGMFTLNFLSDEEKQTLYKAIDLFVLGKLRQAKLSAPVSAREDVFNEINQERIKQDLKWGEQNHAPADWLMILGEEVGEVNKAALEAKFGSSTLREYREELVQVAAVTVAMIECFDRNHLPPPPSK